MMRAVAAVVIGALAFIATMIALHFALPWHVSAIQKEIESSSAFRKMDDPIMMYPFLVAPFVQHALVLWFWNHVGPFPSITNAKSPAATGVWFALYLWIVGAGHGLILDHATFRVSTLLTATWMLDTLLASVVGNAVMFWFYGVGGAATTSSDRKSK